MLPDGTPLAPATVYTVTVNSFPAGGGDGFSVFTEGTERVIGPADLDALVRYIQHLPQPFSAPAEVRISKL